VANSFIGLPTDGAGKKLDTEQLTVGANTVERERMQIVGATATEIARVDDTDPLGTDFALLVRPAAAILPHTDYTFSSALAAGASATLDSNVVPSGKTGKLLQLVVSSSAAAVWVVKSRDGGVESIRATLYTSGVTGGRPTIFWRASHKDAITRTGDGVDTTFRVTVTNLDAKLPADVHVTFEWDEVPS
jgi:hypothetical protein